MKELLTFSYRRVTQRDADRLLRFSQILLDLIRHCRPRPKF